MDSIICIPAWQDNFIWLSVYGEQKAFVIDPGDADPVLHILNSQNLNLTTILLTHHHQDHTGGIKKLKQVTGCEIISPDTKISQTDRIVTDQDRVNLDKISLMVISTPGHTKKSVCYYQQPQENFQPVLWTGDTLFIGGCGRVFETDMNTMWQSLNKLKKLPQETIICPGHDYTEENYRFALTVEPDNEQIQAALSKWNQEKPASSILQAELKTNIFLKAKNAEEFAKLRRAKDVY